jgi:hypothetical protein
MTVRTGITDASMQFTRNTLLFLFWVYNSAGVNHKITHLFPLLCSRVILPVLMLHLAYPYCIPTFVSESILTVPYPLSCELNVNLAFVGANISGLVVVDGQLNISNFLYFDATGQLLGDGEGILRLHKQQFSKPSK